MKHSINPTGFQESKIVKNSKTPGIKDC